jgi:ribosome-binding factor A|uniref:Ribosome-binding factor A n=1 Tax=candidate division WOR-3 bacterium TaxID=2052148 RepID=A0A7C6AEI1_UNCW3
MRSDRVASLIAREISVIISQELRDPRLGMVTITRVTLASDLKEAKVYFTTLGNSANDLHILEGAKGFIRTTLAHRIRIKFIPDLKFIIDDSQKYGEKIDRLLEEIDKGNKET